MYCIKCGVELSDSEEKCPLCGTVVFHPYIKRPDGEKPYPVDRKPQETASRSGLLFILTMLFLLPLATSLLCDWKINGRILWSGYVGGALTAFELLCDNALMDYIRAAKLRSFGAAHVSAYLAAMENETTAARMILTGRLAGLQPAVIRERLRETYA